MTSDRSPSSGPPSEDEKYHLNQLGLLLRQGDLAITALMVAHDRRVTGTAPGEAPQDGDRAFVDVHDFVNRMRDFAGGAMPQFSENSGQLFELLRDLDLATPQAIQAALPDVVPEDEQARLERFNAQLDDPALSLRPETSDLMLIALLHRRQDQIKELLKGRAGRGKGRASRLHRIAVRAFKHD